MLLSSLNGGQLMQQQRFKAFQVRMCDGCNLTGGMRTWQGRVGWRFKEANHHVECRVMNGGGGGGGGTFSGSNEDRKQSEGISTTNLSSSKTEIDTDAFCIIEGRETVLDFAQMQLQEIRDNITRRRNKIFLLMEEVRRLRIQQRIKGREQGVDVTEQDEAMPEYPSSIPFLPPLTTDSLKQYYATCFALVGAIILFGGLIAPVLELKLGMGGTSYADFIRSMHLPLQLSEVDPIVASFSGGAVGVISSLMVVEINNVKQQERKRCRYCHGTGYLACARCAGSGALIDVEPVAIVGDNDSPLSPPKAQRCPTCSGAAKVMCPTCLCTGMALASEHDPRIDPFQ
ncbi:unnamed protein product [Sphagnum troendelagicum]